MPPCARRDGWATFVAVAGVCERGRGFFHTFARRHLTAQPHRGSNVTPGRARPRPGLTKARPGARPQLSEPGRNAQRRSVRAYFRDPFTDRRLVLRRAEQRRSFGSEGHRGLGTGGIGGSPRRDRSRHVEGIAARPARDRGSWREAPHARSVPSPTSTIERASRRAETSFCRLRREKASKDEPEARSGVPLVEPVEIAVRTIRLGRKSHTPTVRSPWAAEEDVLRGREMTIRPVRNPASCTGCPGGVGRFSGRSRISQSNTITASSRGLVSGAPPWANASPPRIMLTRRVTTRISRSSWVTRRTKLHRVGGPRDPEKLNDFGGREVPRPLVEDPYSCPPAAGLHDLGLVL